MASASASSPKRRINAAKFAHRYALGNPYDSTQPEHALVDVAYVIAARFELTEKAGPDDNAGKHLDVFNRRARKGQTFHQPCLGTREFPARFSLLEGDMLPPPPIDETRDLGFMLWDIDHAGDRASFFFRAKLENGIMTVPPPGSPEIRR